MTQLGLDWTADNREHLERVTSRIGVAVLEFCRELLSDHMRNGGFRCSELTEWVKARCGVAPDSPGRILRNLRQRGLIDYVVEDRRASLYRLTAVKA